MELMNMLNKIKSFILGRINLYLYRMTISSKIRRMRNKSKIKVLFVISDVSIWKTESLYCEMLKHSRFEPILGVCLLTADKPSEAIRKYNVLTKYLSGKSYSYIELFSCEINNVVKPDIIFYQQPYDGVIDGNLFFRNNKMSLFCHVGYGFNSTGQKWIGAPAYLHHCWQIYYENSTSMDFYESVMPFFTRNKGCLTGMPFQDILEKNKTEFSNPWKPQNKKKKRIIWAPHHTIPNANNLLEYSTFIDIADDMLEIAQKYSDDIQIAFKPHPFLLKKLYDIWGKEKTDSYYQTWAQFTNTQFESGEYCGLFKHSDALIHDCGSFTIEYLYMGNPVMYLSNGKQHTDTLNEYGKAAYESHIIGKSKDDILRFIQDVIDGKDRLKIERENFMKKYLTIPDTGNASVNIINAILYK